MDRLDQDAERSAAAAHRACAPFSCAPRRSAPAARRHRCRAARCRPCRCRHGGWNLAAGVAAHDKLFQRSRVVGRPVAAGRQLKPFAVQLAGKQGFTAHNTPPVPYASDGPQRAPHLPRGALRKTAFAGTYLTPQPRLSSDSLTALLTMVNPSSPDGSPSRVESWPIAGSLRHQPRRQDRGAGGGRGTCRRTAVIRAAANACPMPAMARARKRSSPRDREPCAARSRRASTRSELQTRHAAGRRPQCARLRFLGSRGQARRSARYELAGLPPPQPLDHRLHDLARHARTRWRKPRAPPAHARS